VRQKKNNICVSEHITTEQNETILSVNALNNNEQFVAVFINIS